VTVDSRIGEPGSANIYFEESPSAGDGSYLDDFTKTSATWFRTVERIEPQIIKTSDTREDQ